MMMISKRLTKIPVALLAIALAAPISSGDTLELKTGGLLDGKYVGGTATTVRFETAEGVNVVEISQIVALTFSARTDAAPETPAPATPAPATPPPAAAMQAAPAATSAITVPAGTPLLVRMMDGISSKNKSGTKFTTVLETDIAVNGVIAIKAGTRIYGELLSSSQAGRAVGKSSIDIRLTEVATTGGTVLIATDNFREAGKGSGGKTVAGAAVGAGVGAVVDGGKGAAKGAAIGAGVSLLKKGETVTVPPNALLEFQLTRSVTVTPVQ